jgi:antitoxin HicB
MAKNKHIGSDFEDFLRDEGMLEEIDARVQKRIIAEQLRTAMGSKKLSEVALARRMDTSRTVVRNLLDPNNSSATLLTLVKAAHAVGKTLGVSFMPARSERGGKKKRSGKPRAA